MDVPKNVMPGPEGTKSDVTLDSSPAASEGVKPQETKPVVAEKPQEKVEQKGDLTPDRNLFAALEEERRMRRELETKLKQLENSAPQVDEDELSDEGRLLKRHVDSMSDRVRSLEETLEFERTAAKFPELKEASDEFNEFRKEYPTISMEKVAKFFLAEKGVVKTERKGLEKPTGGSKEPVPVGMSKDDVKRLRETNPRRYNHLLKTGKLNPDDIR